MTRCSARYNHSAPRFAAALHAGAFAIMRPMFAVFSRYRPRTLTLFVLLVVAALIVLANLSTEVTPVEDGDLKIIPGLWKISGGWPLIWHRYMILGGPALAGTLGWYYHAGRLAGNLAMWFAMLAASGAVCEWRLRRYRPQLRWSLRTMLAAIGLVAAFCAWFAAARNRAGFQDPIIAATKKSDSRVVIERWGPKWLDLVGTDRYRRHIIAAKFEKFVLNGALADEEVEEHLKRLARLPELRYLSLEVEHVTFGMADALGEMRQLRMLSIAERRENDDAPRDDKRISHECLAAIGKMPGLEDLQLKKMAIASESLACLDGLANLKTLRLIDCLNSDVPDDALDSDFDDRPLLRCLPALPQLEVLNLDGSQIGNRDLRYLVILPRLKSLSLADTFASRAGLAELQDVKTLEELTIYDYENDLVSAAGLESLFAVKHLKTLHIDCYVSYKDISYKDIRDKSGKLATLALDNDDELTVLAGEAEAFLRALKALRQSKPGIVIDSYDYLTGMPDWLAEPTLPWEVEWSDEYFRNLPPFPPANRASVRVEELKKLKW